MPQLTRLRGDGIPTRKLGGISALSTGIAQTAAITLAWDASIGATGYKIYVGTATGVYDYPGSPFDVGNVLIHRLENFPDDTYYFSVTAYNGLEEESGFSNELIDTISAVNGLYLSSLGLTLASSGTVTSTAASGILSQTLGVLTATGTGTVTTIGARIGTLSQTLTALTTTVTGTISISGTLGQTLSALTLTAWESAPGGDEIDRTYLYLADEADLTGGPGGTLGASDPGKLLW